MEYKFQDILKNIIPGFYIILGLIILFYIGGYIDLEFVNRVKFVPEEIALFFIPLVFYIVGYVNDILSSYFEYQLYQYFYQRPSELLLNAKKKRYTLLYLSKIKKKLDLSSKVISKEEAYQAFQRANILKDSNDNIIAEFYVSYIFARNLMTANVIIVFTALVFMISFGQYCMFMSVFFVYAILSILFIYRWRQKAIYYSKRVFNSIYLRNCAFTLANKTNGLS